MDRLMIEADGVSKSFGTTVALDDVHLSAERGKVLALLGPNGAGKTTLVRILTTLLPPDRGTARVAGFDVVRQARPLRAAIGLAGQYAAVDELLTGRENLELVGLWYHLDRATYRRRATDILGRFGLSDAADQMVKTYSGGHAPPARHRGQPDRGAAGAVPGRADHRPGPEDPERRLALRS